MANFVFTSGATFVLVEIDGKKAPFSAGEIHPYVNNGAGNIVYLYDTTGILKATISQKLKSRDRIPINLSSDSVNVDGTTVFANADALLTALQEVFFLIKQPIIPDNQRVNTFADLPDATINDGKYYIVDQTSGTWILGTRREAGIYKAVSASWLYRGADVPYYLQDDQFTIKDSGDPTKQLGFEVGGLSSGSRRTITPLDKNYTIGEDRVTVKLIQDINDLLRLHTPNVSNEIELTFPIYEVDSENFDLGVYTLTANRDITLRGVSQAANKIFTSEDNADLITVTNGNLFIQNLILEVTGANSQNIVMSGTGNESLDMFYVQLNGKFGTVADIRQGFWTNAFSSGANEGLTLDGTISGFTLVDSRIINCANFILGAGPGLSINNVRSNVNATIPAGAVAFDFDYDDFTGDGGYQIQTGRFDGAGEMLAPFTDAGRDVDEPEKSTRSLMRNNSGVKAKNTRPGIAFDLVSETLTPLTTNTPAKALGTAGLLKAEHWDLISDTTVAYLNEIPADFTLFYSLLVDGGPNDVIRVDLRKYDDLVTTTNFTVISSLTRSIPNSLGGLDVANFVMPVPDVEINFEERVEIWLTNTTDGTDATLKIGSKVFIRPS